MTGDLKKYKLAMFDLDGTLTDSSPGIFNTLREVFPVVGWPAPAEEELRTFIGPPLWNSLYERYGMPMETADEFVCHFRERYAKKGIYENSLYPGMHELLTELRRAGIRTAVVTSKPLIPATEVLRYVGVTELFDYVSAADDSDKGGGKEELILPVLQKSGIPAEETVMIGDTRFDASGARIAGTDFIGVLYGFGTKQEMEKEGGGKFSDTVEGLRPLLIGKTLS